MGLGRLYVGHSRDEADGFGVVITQNYELGQFALDSAYLRREYFELLKEKDKARRSRYDDESDEVDD